MKPSSISSPIFQSSWWFPYLKSGPVISYILDISFSIAKHLQNWAHYLLSISVLLPMFLCFYVSNKWYHHLLSAEPGTWKLSVTHLSFLCPVYCTSWISWLWLLLFTSAPGLPYSLLNDLPIPRLDLWKSLHNQTRLTVLKCRYDYIIPCFVLNSTVASPFLCVTEAGNLSPVGPVQLVLFCTAQELRSCCIIKGC